MTAEQAYKKDTGAEATWEPTGYGGVADVSFASYIQWLEQQLEQMWLLYGNPHVDRPQGVITASELRVQRAGVMIVNVGEEPR